MPDLLVVQPSAVRTVIAYLNTVLPARPEPYAEGAKAGAKVPGNWRADTSKPFVTVANDGTPAASYPVAAWTTIRCTVRALNQSTADDLAALIQGLLCARRGDGKVNKIDFLTGVLSAEDPDSGAAMASITVRAATRLQTL